MTEVTPNLCFVFARAIQTRGNPLYGLERRRELAAYELAATQGLRFGECKREVEILSATLFGDQNLAATRLAMQAPDNEE